MIKLSIITINYNDAEGLSKTLASVAAQTYPHIQHIIVDGGSTDGSVEIIREYADNRAAMGNGQWAIDSDTNRQSPIANRQIKWISEPDKGIYNAMNKGIEIALGRREVREDHTSLPIANGQSPIAQTDYIQILNAGDLLVAPNVTKKMVDTLRDQSVVSITGNQQNGIPILYGNMIKQYPNGKRFVDKCLGDRNKSNKSVREIEWTMYDFIKGTINHDPTYIHWTLYEKYGLYDDNLKIVSDWKWFVKAVVFGEERVFYTPIDVTIFDMTGISETNLVEREEERHNELEKMLPIAVLKDYDNLHFPIEQYRRLKKYCLWGFVYFIERVLFKLEKWNVLKR